MKLPRLSQYLQEVSLTSDELRAIRKNSLQDTGKMSLSAADKISFRRDKQSIFRRALDQDGSSSLVLKMTNLLSVHLEKQTVPSQGELNTIFTKINTFLNSRTEIKSDKDKDSVVADAIAILVSQLENAGRFPMYLSLALHKGWLIFDKSHVDQKFEKYSSQQDVEPQQEAQASPHEESPYDLDHRKMVYKKISDEFRHTLESEGKEAVIQLLADKLHAKTNPLLAIKDGWKLFMFNLADRPMGLDIDTIDLVKLHTRGLGMIKQRHME